MIIVMNVVEVSDERTEGFEEAFRSRERMLAGAEGFAGFELLRRDTGGEYPASAG